MACVSLLPQPALILSASDVFSAQVSVVLRHFQSTSILLLKPLAPKFQIAPDWLKI